MVLGLIDFLLGGKKKNKIPKTAQVVSPVGGSNVVGNATPQGGVTSLPDGISEVTQNTQADQNNQSDNLEFQDSNNTTTQPQAVASGQNVNNRKSISEVILKIHGELKSTNETLTSLVGEVKDIQNSVSSLNSRVGVIEESNKKTASKLSEVDDNMGKFLSLYELVNNQYNPFVDEESKNPQKRVVVSSTGDSFEELNSDDLQNKIKNLDVTSSNNTISVQENVDSALLELDTLNIEEAAGDAVPLTNLKSNTNSLVVILSWLEYLVKKVGVEETRNNLRYYTETLKWITPEVYFELDKYLRGMSDKDLKKGSDKILSVKDHIVSLYFISKLNEKTLDVKLTKAVLQIIKE